MGLLQTHVDPQARPPVSIGILDGETSSSVSRLPIHGRSRPLAGASQHQDRRDHADPQHLRLDYRSDNLLSEDVLFLILRHVVADDEARSAARQLLEQFGTLGAVLAAKEQGLFRACGERETCVSLLRCAHLFMKAVLREPVEDRPVLRDLAALFDYLRISMAHEANEVVRILFLNNRNALLKDEEHSRGSVNHVPIYPREILKRVIEVNASAIIIVHNHPSGDPKPSKEDVEMTQRLVRVLNDIGVELHDHVIVGVSRCESMRSLRLM